MKVEFCKYSATGNDFIVIDNRKLGLKTSGPKAKESWARLCHRRLGIGADGVLLVENFQDKDLIRIPDKIHSDVPGDDLSSNIDFKMVYLNADGGPADMCGNGARAITHFFHTQIGKAPSNRQHYYFLTPKGCYHSYIARDSDINDGGNHHEDPNIIKVEMTEIYSYNEINLQGNSKFLEFKNCFYLNTGVPHALFELSSDQLANYPVDTRGRELRYHSIFAPHGANINFFSILDIGRISIRTYERGVEAETLSCGTGAVAGALTVANHYHWSSPVLVETKGGNLEISFEKAPANKNNLKSTSGQAIPWQKVYLSGPVHHVFSGSFIYKEWFEVGTN